MKSIHQVVAGFSRGDAISNEATLMRDVFRSWGHPSEIYCEENRTLPELRREIRDVGTLSASLQPDDLVLLHLSIGSIVNDVFAELPCRKALLYHNITPPHLLKGLQPQTARHAERGLEQLKALAHTAEVNLADSAFNARELEQHHYADVRVFPLLLDFDHLSRQVDRKTMRRCRDGLTNILFVGRCVPNKRIEDVLAAFYYYQRYVQPASRLIHAGSFAGTERYHAYLLSLVYGNDMQHTEMPGAVEQPVLNAYYETADLFVCMSEHEGFCIPLLEAMARDVPVMAYDAGAVAETMDGAGVLVKEKRFDQLAEMMGLLTGKHPLRQQIIEGQRQRIQRYRARDGHLELRTHLAPLLA